MSYIDGFVAAVPRNNKDAYRQHASGAVPMFKGYGATRQVEAWGDDVPDGKVTDFKGAVKATPEEEIVFAWLEYPDKETRDKANQKMMDDPAMKEMGAKMPFDGKRMIWGGFQPINDSGKSGRPGYVDACVTPVPAANKDAYKETDYKGAVKAKPGEKIVFSWIEWPSKEARDKGWEKAMADPRMKEIEMPFDGQRMIYGGFAPLLDQ
jgi:uncharacterized protein YbaA (DUF1428 family)